MDNDTPNVLWIMADELRTDALSCYGTPHPSISTPNIDRIAADGVLFEQAYTTSPVCVPARYAMLSGISPLSSGVLNNEGYGPEGADDVEMFPDMLAAAGWTTRNYGKEHLPRGRAPWQKHDPTGSSMPDLRRVADDRGVDLVRSPGIGHILSGVLPEGTETGGEAITRSVSDELRRADGPMLLRASYLQPHKPLIVPEPWATMYDDVTFDVAASPAEETSEFEQEWGRLTRGSDLDENGRQLSFRRYHGAVAWLDVQVGQILQALDESGRRESTIIVFTTDHGASLGEHGILAKHTFAPESHRVPLIISWPEKLAAGMRRSDLATSEDVATTILGLVGVEPPHGVTGRDLFNAPAPDVILSAIGYGEPGSRAFPHRDEGAWEDGRGWPQRVCARTTRYRLDLTTRRAGERVHTDEDVFLTDRLRDPSERTDLSSRSEYRDVRTELESIVYAAADAIPRPLADAAAFAQTRRMTPPV